MRRTSSETAPNAPVPATARPKGARWHARAIAIIALGLLIGGADRGDWKRGEVIDVHGHLSPRMAQLIDGVLRENGISMMVNLSGGSTARSFARAREMTRTLGGRVVHFYNPNWRGIDRPDWAEREADGLRRAVTRHGYRGLKISKALGLGVREVSGVVIAVDDERLMPLWDMAALLGVPVAIHTGDPKAFWDVLDESNERWDELGENPGWSYHHRHETGEVDSWTHLLDAFEEVVRRHSATDFIGVHFANAPEDIDRVARMLDSYPNLYADIAARIGEIGRHRAEKVRTLFMRHQDRILFGTDIGITPYGLMLGAPGKEPSTPKDIKPFFDLHWRWLETAESPMPHPVPIQGNWPVHGIDLPADVLDRIYSKNARRLLRLDE